MIVWSVTIIVIGLLLASVFCRKQTVNVPVFDGRVLSLHIPSAWSLIGNSSCVLNWKGCNKSTESAKLLYGIFETPIWLLPSLENNRVICLYDFDVTLQLIVFDLGVVSGDQIRNDDSLKHILISSDWKVRHATASEEMFVMSQLEAVNRKDFYKQSVPCLDLGFLRLYKDPKLLLQRLRAQIYSTKKSAGQRARGPALGGTSVSPSQYTKQVMSGSGQQNYSPPIFDAGARKDDPAGAVGSLV